MMANLVAARHVETPFLPPILHPPSQQVRTQTPRRPPPREVWILPENVLTKLMGTLVHISLIESVKVSNKFYVLQ